MKQKIFYCEIVFLKQKHAEREEDFFLEKKRELKNQRKKLSAGAGVNLFHIYTGSKF
jgi:hypothetical protein